MIKIIQRPETLIAAFLLLLLTIVSAPVWSAPRVLEKSYKRYSLYPYMGNDILCEPYTVKKGDWVYKILKSKGEISKTDFSLFLKIFQALNPDIKDIDTIRHNQTILIPLKKINRKEFAELAQGRVDIPIIQMSDIKDKLSEYAKQHEVKEGETLYMIMDKAFLNDKGILVKKGRIAFEMLNPKIRDINLIYAGMTLNLPQPEILSQAWFDDFILGTENIFLNGERPPIIQSQGLDADQAKYSSFLSPMQEQYLEDYSLSVGGRVLKQGTYFFPRQQTRDVAIDLSTHPMIQLADHSKIIFMPKKNEPALTLSISSLQDVKMMTLPEQERITGNALNSLNGTKALVSADIPEAQLIPSDQKDAVKKIMQTSNYPYLPEHYIAVPVGNISIKIRLGKIKRPEKADLLLIFGDVYGSVLDELKKQGEEIVLLSPFDNVWDVTEKIFTTLGVSTTHDPSLLLTETNQAVTLPGLYIEDPGQAIFISRQILDFKTTSFLEQKKVKILYAAIP